MRKKLGPIFKLANKKIFKKNSKILKILVVINISP